MRRSIVWLLLFLCAGCPSGSTSSSATPSVPDLQVANATSPGETLDLPKLAVAGKTTLVEFTSERCPACAEMAPAMDFLSRHKEGLAIRQVVIDRPGSSGIDFDSPLARQWQVDSVPSFVILDETGRIASRGSDAKDQVKAWYGEAQMMRDGNTSEAADDYLESQ